MQVKQHYANDDLELEVKGTTYHVNVTAEGTYTYEKGTYWEPGYEGFEVEGDDVEAIWSDEEGNVVEETPEMGSALMTYLESKADWEDIVSEPDDDYYEERAIARWEAQCDRMDV